MAKGCLEPMGNSPIHRGQYQDFLCGRLSLCLCVFTGKQVGETPYIPVHVPRGQTGNTVGVTDYLLGDFIQKMLFVVGFEVGVEVHYAAQR